MIDRRLALAAVIVALCGPAAAQGTRTSSFHPNSSVTFHRYFEPFPRFDNAGPCRDACVANPACSGWTWYENIPANDERLRNVCILGSGLKDSRIGNAPGRHAGLVTVK